MDILYLHDGLVVGTCPSTSVTPLPPFLRVPTRHTRADLERIDLKPSNCILTFHSDQAYNKDLDWHTITSNAYIDYLKRCRVPAPKFERWQDTLRFRAYQLLRRCRVTC